MLNLRQLDARVLRFEHVSSIFFALVPQNFHISQNQQLNTNHTKAKGILLCYLPKEKCLLLRINTICNDLHHSYQKRKFSQYNFNLSFNLPSSPNIYCLACSRQSSKHAQFLQDIKVTFHIGQVPDTYNSFKLCTP